MRSERGKLGEKRRVVRPFGAHEQAAPRFIAMTEAKHELAAEVDGLRTEHRAEEKRRIGFKRFPQPLQRMHPLDPQGIFGKGTHRTPRVFDDSD